MKEKKTSRKLALLPAMFLALLLVGLGVRGVYWVIRDGTPGLASSSWPPVPATVLDGTLKQSYGRNAGWIPKITFSFPINGKRYFSNRFSFPTTSYPRTRAEAILRDYPVGQTVTAYYNPKDPAQACLKPGHDWFFLFIIPFISLILLSGGVLIGIMTMRGVRTDKRMKAAACTVKQGFSGGEIRIGLYRFDINLKILDQGECNCDKALRSFELCNQNSLLSYRSGEEAMAATSFGLSKSKDDFIEISCNGNDAVSIHSDRLCYPSSLNKAFCLNNHYFIHGDKDKGVEVIRDYFSLDRLQFEDKYKTFLSR